MFEKLFGGTINEQIDFLQPKVLITAPISIFGFIAMLFGAEIGKAVIAIAIYVWAATFLKFWFGLTALGIFFSGNIVIGVIFLVAYLITGYFIGLLTFCFGLFRYIYLRIITS